MNRLIRRGITEYDPSKLVQRLIKQLEKADRAEDAGQ
jgi:hypothetical protein